MSKKGQLKVKDKKQDQVGLPNKNRSKMARGEAFLMLFLIWITLILVVVHRLNE